MRKSIILLIILFIISGCGSSKERNEVSNIEEKEQPIETEKIRNKIIITNIRDILDNTDSLDYKFDMEIGNELLISGIKYQNVIKGKAKSNKTTIDFQYEDNNFYNLKTKKKIANPIEGYEELLFVNYFNNVVDDLTCQYVENKYICWSNTEDISLIIKTKDEIITSIEYDNYIENIKYKIYNYNDVSVISKINYKSLDIKYKKTNKIKTITKKYTNDLMQELTYKLVYYNIDDVSANAYGERIEISKIEDIENGAMYFKYLQYSKNKFVEQLIFDNNFTIIYRENEFYYYSTLDNEKDVLKLINSNN